MQWKKVYARERTWPGTDDPRIEVEIPELAGRRVRVTVEEAVDECCEKWRGANIYTLPECSRLLAGGGVLMHQEPRFCPECGKRL